MYKERDMGLSKVGNWEVIEDLAKPYETSIQCYGGVEEMPPRFYNFW
jgi:hypothetical protein